MEEHIYCPITKQIMRDPVVAADGFMYENKAISNWFKSNSRSPLTNKIVDKKILPVFHVKKFIDQYCKENPELKKDRYVQERPMINHLDKIKEHISIKQFNKLKKYQQYDFRKFSLKTWMDVIGGCDDKILIHLIDNTTNYKINSDYNLLTLCICRRSPQIVAYMFDNTDINVTNDHLQDAYRFGSYEMVLLVDNYIESLKYNNEDCADDCEEEDDEDGRYPYQEKELDPIFITNKDIFKKLEFRLPKTRVPTELTFSNFKDKDFKFPLSSLLSYDTCQTFVKNSEPRTVRKVCGLLDQYCIDTNIYPIKQVLNNDYFDSCVGSYIFKDEEDDEDDEDDEYGVACSLDSDEDCADDLDDLLDDLNY
jgi:hypothetical protein